MQTRRSKREYLRELVAGKNHWCGRQLTDEERRLGFLGWHERGYLPHCDFPGLVQFVTFRLADSMPASRRGEWEHLLAIEDLREKRTKLEDYLDRGIGECWLRQDACCTSLQRKRYCIFHKKRYELLAWCVMPNHVHVLVHVWRDASVEDGQKLEAFMPRSGASTRGAPSLRLGPFQTTTPTSRLGAGAPIKMATRILGHVHA